MDKRTVQFNALLQEHYELYQVLWADYVNGTCKGKDWYDNYNAEIQRIVPKERLLVLNVKQGWRPLCEFLKTEEPLYPFPKKYDSMQFNRELVQFSTFLDAGARWNAIKTASGVLVAVVAMALATRSLNPH